MAIEPNPIRTDWSETNRSWTVTLTRPEARNAINRALLRQLDAALKATPSEAHSVVFTAAGPVFSAGADLKERRGFDDAQTLRFLDDLRAVFGRIEQCPVPTIAVLQGGAYGGGLELALCCDFIVAWVDAPLCLPEVKLGIIPGAGGTQRLWRRCGPDLARRLVLLAEAVPAKTLPTLVHATAPTPAATRELAEPIVSRLATLPRGAVVSAKLALRQAAVRERDLDIERLQYEARLSAPERKAALRHFGAKSGAGAAP